MENENNKKVEEQTDLHELIKNILSSVDTLSEGGKIEAANKIAKLTCLIEHAMPHVKQKNLYKLHFESCEHFVIAESIGAAEQLYNNNMPTLNEKGFKEIVPIAIENIASGINANFDITDSVILIHD